MPEINHEYTDEVVCPHCGYEHTDSWDRPDSDEDECGECGKPFQYSRSTTVKYSTAPIDPKDYRYAPAPK